MFERIVVPLDGSKEAEIVIPYVEEIAVHFSNEIILISVVETSVPDIKHIYFSYLESIVRQLQRDIRDYKFQQEIKIRSEFLPGEPAKQILGYAVEQQANLIVMASRGSSGQSPWILGNIAAKVLRAATQPVLLIRTSVEPGFPINRALKKILVPLDGSQRGAAAIPYVEALARAFQAEIVLLQAVVYPETYAHYGNAYIAPPKPEELKSISQTYLDRVALPLRNSGLKISSAIDIGPPADTILDYAQAKAVDLIAMATHGRTGIGRWVFGSVTDKILHAGNTPVLVVRSPH
jgi:nucleotide-binding universal stress UspA family protein